MRIKMHPSRCIPHIRFTRSDFSAGGVFPIRLECREMFSGGLKTTRKTARGGEPESSRVMPLILRTGVRPCFGGTGPVSPIISPQRRMVPAQNPTRSRIHYYKRSSKRYRIIDLHFLRAFNFANAIYARAFRMSTQIL